MKTIILSLLLVSILSPDKKLPELNAKIVDYVNQVKGKKVARGECWDLAAGALAHSGAYFDRSTKKSVLIYGRRVNPTKEEVLPGDLIQFENVVVQWKDKKGSYTENMGHHTAIVYRVNADKNYEIAHQNTSSWGKKVGISNFRLDRVKKGKIMIYRPIKQK